MFRVCVCISDLVQHSSHSREVMLQALREEPPTNAKCKDKFLIQSTLITAEKETMALQDIVRLSAILASSSCERSITVDCDGRR
jgi:hypothetical protein